MNINQMESDIDILRIHEDINNNIKIQLENRVYIERRLNHINSILENDDLKDTILRKCEKIKKELIQTLDNITNNYYFYINESTPIIESYKDMLKKPIKMSFMGKSVSNNEDKKKLVISYIEIVKKYKLFDNEITSIHDNTRKFVCDNCNNKKHFDFIEDDTVLVCKKCFNQKTIYNPMISYNDNERVNMSNKYTYDRKVHFRDCINQYQAKQNSIIKPEIMKALEEEFRKHHLLNEKDENGNVNPDNIKFGNITKKHIMMFLKDLKYTNNYENVNLIHYKFTGIPPPDISHLEDKLLQDFDILTELYDKTFKNINRKNFINTQYVLYQLLCRHKFKCKKEEFVILKTVDRKFFHDKIIKTLFEILGWNYKPFF